MINVSFRKRGVPSVRLLVALALVAFSAGAADICLTEKEPVRGRVDDPREDLCAGFQVSAQVRFDADPATWGQMTILQKGVNDRGSYILRVDGPKEGTKFSFFVNVDGSPEPRVSVPIHPTTGVWYRVNAGWDGTNAWLDVNGQRASKRRVGTQSFYPYSQDAKVGPQIAVCGEVWTDRADAALSATVDDPKAMVAWEQYEGPSGVRFAKPAAACTKATFPGEGDYRVTVKADNGTLWRAAHTAVHILPAGARTFHAWDFAKNLDTQGWRTEGTGTSYQFIPGKVSFWSTESFPVQLVCGDYYVIAVKNSGTAAIVTPDDRDVGVCFDAKRANAVRIKMQNHTTSTAMRLWWQTDGTPSWDETRSVVFAVDPLADDDRVYTIPMPQIGTIKQFKLSFAADGQPVTGTVRIDYIWCGSL